MLRRLQRAYSRAMIDSITLSSKSPVDQHLRGKHVIGFGYRIPRARAGSPLLNVERLCSKIRPESVLDPTLPACACERCRLQVSAFP
jgi:hypothetical protein